MSSSAVALRLQNTTVSELFISGDYTQHVTTQVDVDVRDPTRITLLIKQRPASTLYNGTYTDRINFNACLDQVCNRPLVGSPLSITITFTVTGTDPVTGGTGPPPDTMASPLPVLSRVALSHDVRDAEYSRNLDRVVMAATYPGNALYVYDPASGAETSVALAEEPTAVSISPDGLTAAVGHRGSISVVDLVQVGQPQPPEPLHVVTTANAFDVVLDNQGRAHFTSEAESEFTPVYLHTIELASGIEWRGNSIGYGSVFARLEPVGGYLFTGYQGASGVEKWDITSTPARWINAGDAECSASQGCGKIWFNESGSRVYSQNGRVIGTDGPLNMHLPHEGTIPLSDPGPADTAFRIVWLEHFAALNEIALVENQATWCDLPTFGKPCYPRFGTFDSELLTRQSIHSIAPMEIDGTFHIQRGTFVFYRSNGAGKVLLSWLDTMSDLDRAYYLSVLN